MIKDYRTGKAIVQETLLTALDIAALSAPIISVIGGGGKTTVIKKLVKEYAKEHPPAIATTATSMEMPENSCILTGPDMEMLAKLIKKEKVVWFGTIEENQKISAFPIPFLEAARMLHIPILIETDSSGGKPCNVPAEHEPALWGKTTVAIAIFGLDGIGHKIADVCHRPEYAEKLLKKCRDERLTCADIVTIGLSDLGMKKLMDPYMKFKIILNKADNDERISVGEQTVKLFAKKGFRDVLLTSNLLEEAEMATKNSVD